MRVQFILSEIWVALRRNLSMSISVAPDATAAAASCALIAVKCLPDGKPATAATRTRPAPASTAS